MGLSPLAKSQHEQSEHDCWAQQSAEKWKGHQRGTSDLGPDLGRGDYVESDLEQGRELKAHARSPEFPYPHRYFHLSAGMVLVWSGHPYRGLQREVQGTRGRKPSLHLRSSSQEGPRHSTKAAQMPVGLGASQGLLVQVLDGDRHTHPPSWVK